MPLRRGTYCRERDGALHLYYSPLTCWNHPVYGLEFYQKNPNVSTIDRWEHVTAMDEIYALRDYLGGTHLKAGEYVEVHEP